MFPRRYIFLIALTSYFISFEITFDPGSYSGFQPDLGYDVTHCALSNANPVKLTAGTLVAVRRSDGRVTVARVEHALSTTPPGFVHVTLALDGTWKHVHLNDLFSLPAPEQVIGICLSAICRHAEKVSF